MNDEAVMRVKTSCLQLMHSTRYLLKFMRFRNLDATLIEYNNCRCLIRPEHVRGGPTKLRTREKMSWRERNFGPYPQHMTGILGPIEKYHSKDSW